MRLLSASVWVQQGMWAWAYALLMMVASSASAFSMDDLGEWNYEEDR